MEDGDHNTSPAALSMTTTTTKKNNNHDEEPAPAPVPAAAATATERTRSGSSSSTHRRSMSGSLLSKLSFLRSTNQPTTSTSTSTTPDQQTTAIDEQDDDDDGDDYGTPGSNASTGLRGGKAMASALQQQQQQRRTRKRRGSLRKTALLGTRFESKKVNRAAAAASGNNGNMVEGLRGDDGEQQSAAKNSMWSFPNSVSSGAAAFNRGGREGNPRWGHINAQQKKPHRGSVSSRHESDLVRNNAQGEETVTDDEDMLSFRRLNNNNNQNDSAIAADLQHKHLKPPSSDPEPYYGLQADSPSAYETVHRTTKPSLATTTHHHHASDPNHQEKIIWDYSETEWWGWIILLVTWLVFVVGMGSCFGVWSWAWDVGETPYAPPELEDDPTLPIVGYYPALIILTAVMSWVWVVVAWVGMKYFKHANISGEDI